MTEQSKSQRRLLIGLVVALAVVAIAAAGVASATKGLVPYQLYTHCGIRYADFEGTRFYADPPLDDGNGNPPSGWGNPYDGGWLTLQDQDTVTFRDLAGHRASFSTHPKSGIPNIGICS